LGDRPLNQIVGRLRATELGLAVLLNAPLKLRYGDRVTKDEIYYDLMRGSRTFIATMAFITSALYRTRNPSAWSMMLRG
jgi:hypothetical protein